jgi:small conductance mechanosensitive channel
VDKPIRLAVACAMVAIGWSLARNLGRAVQPRLALEFDPASAGVAGFLVRLLTLIAIALVSLRIAGLQPGALALGATFTAVIVGLAAQQTFGNVFAGVVLLSARPFQVGDRVRFNGFGMDVEGTVAEHGLLYVTLTDGEDVVMIPNSTALTMSVRPLRQPAAIDLRARLPLGIDPPTIEQRIAEAVTVPIKEDSPHVALEEVDGDEVAVRIQATPADSRKGGELAREILDAVIELRREGGGRDARPRSDSIAAARS